MEICTGTVIKVYADPDYRYEVEVGGQLTLKYIENDADGLQVGISFGNAHEMLATGRAMIRAAEMQLDGIG